MLHLRRASALLALSPFFALAAEAQIILPGKGQEAKKEKGGDLAPHLVCAVCGERNYNLHDDGRRDEQGLVIAWCVHCKRDTSQRPPDPPRATSSGKAMGKGGRLVLPTKPLAPVGDRPETLPSGPAPSAPTARVTTGSASSSAAPKTNRPAAFIFAEVKRLKRVDDSLALRAVESLLALGPEGLAAARENLAAEEAPALMTAARVLLRSGRPEDADLVCERLRGPLPIAAGAPLLDLLAKADPVRGSPRFLAEMLDHPHAGVRAAAQKHLSALATADLLPLLEPALASKRADTRKRALEVAGGVDGSGATQILLTHVADSSADVAAAAAGALAGREDPDLDAKLLGMAFRERWILRPGACALLAIVEREDRAVRPILDETRIEPLVTGLQSADPFFSGACAAALSGIGFRSRSPQATGWLDQDVVDRLVAAVSGRKFHSDLPALTGPALRRLELLTGQGIGSDGPRWVDWWVHAREGFFARRAWLDVPPADAPRISVRFKQGGAEAVDFTLLGPALETAEGAANALAAGASQTVRLSEGQARDLVAALEREGVLGPELLPGVRGLRGGDERTLEIAIAGRGKSFVFGSGQTEPWFERSASLARDLLDRNRWQRYPDPARHASSYELWKEQSAWWAEEHPDIERALRLKQLVLSALPALPDSRRNEGIAELERLYARSGAAEPADFAPLAQLLATQRFWAEPARRVLDLALRAARTRGAIGAEATPAEGEKRESGERDVPVEQGRLLVDLLVEKFPAAPAENLSRVFAACGPGFASTMAGDPRPTVRAAAARGLAETGPGETEDSAPAPETVATLLRLLGDPDGTVEVAAVEALGRRRVETARTELLVRARLGLPDVRAAALRAVGRLRGELVLDALSLAAADSDPRIRLAAAWGLSDLRDPSSAQLLIGMLGEGDSAPTVEPARAGLLALGSAAWNDLLRVVHSPSHRARREAALLLSRQGVPEAASALMAMLSSEPKDAHIASELAVLSGVDLRAEADPAGAWWSWWDSVVHDDSLAWFIAALARVGATSPAKEALCQSGNRDGRLFLLEVLARREAHLVERARRELSRMLGRDLGSLPPRGGGRDAWIAALRASIAEPDGK
jgi:HEAT repeat protein